MLTKLTLLLTAAAAAILGTPSQDLQPTEPVASVDGWQYGCWVYFTNPPSNQPPNITAIYVSSSKCPDAQYPTTLACQLWCYEDWNQQVEDWMESEGFTGISGYGNILDQAMECGGGGESNLDYGDDGWEYSVRVRFRDQTQLMIETKDFWTEKCPDAQYPTPLACQLWCYENIHDQIREWEIMTGWTAVQVRLKWDQPKTCD